MSADDDEAIEVPPERPAHDGSSDSPFTYVADFFDYLQNAEYWVYVGASFDLDFLDPDEGMVMFTSGFGLHYDQSKGYLSGNLAKTGDLKIDRVYGDGTTKTVIFHVVSESPTLEFQSNPSDGLIAWAGL